MEALIGLRLILGCIITDYTDQKFILSNNHVIANSNLCSTGDKILQPGVYDGGVVGKDDVASLDRWVEVKFTELPP